MCPRNVGRSKSLAKGRPVATIVGEVTDDGRVLQLSDVSATWGSDDLVRIVKAIARRKSASLTQLQQSFSHRLNAEELGRVLRVLHERRVITEKASGDRGGLSYTIASPDALATVEWGSLLRPLVEASSRGNAHVEAEAGVVTLSCDDRRLQMKEPLRIAEPNLWVYQNRCVTLCPEPLDRGLSVLAVKKAVLTAITAASDMKEQLQREVERLEKRVPGLRPIPEATVEVRPRIEIYSHIRRKLLPETPEETVRQEFVKILVNHYGYGLAQMEEEMEVTGSGSARARADIVVWATPREKAEKKNPLVVVECKQGRGTIAQAHYEQGANYARMLGAQFLVACNEAERRYWRVDHERLPKDLIEVEDIPKTASLGPH